MSGSTEIRIAYALLDTLAADAATAAEALAEGSSIVDLDFTGTPEITAAYRRFLDRWDKHRGALQSSIAAAAEAFGIVSQTFADTEDRLIGLLAGDS